MRIVRGRRDARWLPSRHTFAVFRLAAYLRCRMSSPEPAEVILVANRDQSAFENFSVCLWIVSTVICYLAATLFRSWPIVPALALALPTALIAIEVPFFLFAPLLSFFDPKTRLRAQSAGMMLLHLLGSAWLATTDSWARFVAWPVLALAVLNAIAAIALFLMRGPIARLESSFGGTTSDL